MSASTDILRLVRTPKAAALYLAGVGAVSALLALGLFAMQETLVRSTRLATVVPTAATTPAIIARHVRAAALITSKIETTIRAQTSDADWRGTVIATVEAPATLSFGVDLSKVDSSRVRMSGIGGVCVLVVPPPTRVATEVRTGDERFRVEVGGLSLRAVGGEYQLGLARARLYEQAARFRPNPQQHAEIRAAAREQIAAVARGVLGEPSVVRVVFEDEQLTLLDRTTRQATAQ
jgi:hypothetical protein